MTYIDSKGQQITRLQAVEYLSEWHVQEMEEGIRELYKAGVIEKEELMVMGELGKDGTVKDSIQDTDVSPDVILFDIIESLLASVGISLILFILGVIGCLFLSSTNVVDPLFIASAWTIIVYYSLIVGICSTVLIFGAKLIASIFWRDFSATHG